MIKNLVIVFFFFLGLASCSDEIKCEADSSFYQLYKDGNRPSNKEAMQHMSCYDSDGKRI